VTGLRHLSPEFVRRHLATQTGEPFRRARAAAGSGATAYFGIALKAASASASACAEAGREGPARIQRSDGP
jgi:hypothetical protein